VDRAALLDIGFGIEAFQENTVSIKYH